jgi:predicted secreted protein
MADKVQGKNIILYKVVGGTSTPFACSTNCNFSVQVDQKDVTSQTSAWFREFKIDIASWTVTCEGLVTLTGYSYSDMLTNQLARNTIAVKFTIDNGSSTTIISGNANITSLSINAPYKDIATYSVSLQGIGAYTLT